METHPQHPHLVERVDAAVGALDCADDPESVERLGDAVATLCSTRDVVGIRIAAAHIFEVLEEVEDSQLRTCLELAQSVLWNSSLEMAAEPVDQGAVPDGLASRIMAKVREEPYAFCLVRDMAKEFGVGTTEVRRTAKELSRLGVVSPALRRNLTWSTASWRLAALDEYAKIRLRGGF